MPNPNMELIQAVTVGAGGAANIEFTNIPQTYTDLLLKLSGRSSRSGAPAEEFLLTFNNNTSSIYTERHLRGNGSTAISQTFTNYTAITQIGQSGAAATANTFASWDIYIPNYAGSNNKSISLDGVTENNSATAGNALTYLSAGLWASSSAITSIKISAGSYLVEQYSTAYLYGVTSAGYGAKATGGNIISQDADYYYHIFTSSGTFTPTQSITADYLVVAGGGGTTGDRSGGGGAGGLRCTVNTTGGGGSLESPLSLTAQAYTVTIGAGGPGKSNGTNSVFSTITSAGGGGGGRTSDGNGSTGGSGGGGAGETGRSGGVGTTNQGYAGGGGAATGAGGGGGAGSIGANGSGPEGSGIGGAGGIGITTTMAVGGISTYYAGGGGGYGNTGGLGGLGGGGNGSYGGTGAPNTNGTINTGGGAGGGHGAMSGTGGSGIVVIRYAK